MDDNEFVPSIEDRPEPDILEEFYSFVMNRLETKDDLYLVEERKVRVPSATYGIFAREVGWKMNCKDFVGLSPDTMKYKDIYFNSMRKGKGIEVKIPESMLCEDHEDEWDLG